MPMIITPESELGRELAKWNLPRNQYLRDSNGDPIRDSQGQLIYGKNCVGYEEYPKMLYQARKLPNGQVSVGEVPPHPMYCTREEFEHKSLFVEGFNKSCQKIVNNKDEENKAKAAGWCNTMPQALEAYEKEQQYFAKLAAEEEFRLQKMSKKARAEFAAAQDASDKHVVDLKPKRKRGRPAKGVQPVTGEGDAV